MAFKRYNRPPNIIFWVILIVVFKAFWTHKTAKKVQNGPNFGQKRLSQGQYAACKCWQSAFMHFAGLRQQLYFYFFFLSAGCAGGFPAHDLGDSLPV